MELETSLTFLKGALFYAGGAVITTIASIILAGVALGAKEIIRKFKEGEDDERN